MALRRSRKNFVSNSTYLYFIFKFFLRLLDCSIFFHQNSSLFFLTFYETIGMLLLQSPTLFLVAFLFILHQFFVSKFEPNIALKVTLTDSFYLCRMISLSCAKAFSLSSASCCLKFSNCCWVRRAAFTSRSSNSFLCKDRRSEISCWCLTVMLCNSGSKLLTVNSWKILRLI